MTSAIPTLPKLKFFDDIGNPAAGFLLYIYSAGSTTFVNTWQDQGQLSLNTNPIILDANGECVVWVDPLQEYDFVLKTSTGATISTINNISGVSLSQLALSSGSSMIGFIQSGTGAVVRTLQSKNREIISVKDFGAVGDGIADDTNAINNANVEATATGRTLFFPAGTYISSGIPAIAGMSWRGESEFTSIIKLKSGTNAGLVTSSTSSIDNVHIEKLRFDGNYANNSSGDTLTIKGSRTSFRDISVFNSAGTAITTDWLQPYGITQVMGQAGSFINVTIDTSQESGWIHNGPSDSHFSDIVIIDAGVKTNNTYYGLRCNSNGRFDKIHNWNRGYTTNTPGSGVFIPNTSGGCNFTNSHFEGSNLPLNISGNGNTFKGCYYYATRGPFCVFIPGTSNLVDGIIGGGSYSGNLNYGGVYLSGVGNIIDISDGGCLNGAMTFVAPEANNIVRITGYRSSGTVAPNTPHATDYVLVSINGPSGLLYIQETAIPWASYTPTVTAGTGAFASASATGSYNIKCKTVVGSAVVTVTSVGTGGYSTQFSLPVAARSGSITVTGRDSSTGAYVMGFLQSASVVNLQSPAGAFVGASGTHIDVNFMYEAA